MASSGNYKRVPDEDTFIPTVVRRPQSKTDMEKQLESFAKMMQSRKEANGG